MGRRRQQLYDERRLLRHYRRTDARADARADAEADAEADTRADCIANAKADDASTECVVYDGSGQAHVQESTSMSRWNFDFDIDATAIARGALPAVGIVARSGALEDEVDYDTDDCDYESDEDDPRDEEKKRRREACRAAEAVWWTQACWGALICLLPLLALLIACLLAPPRMDMTMPPTPMPMTPSICLQDCPVNENETLVSACSEQGQCSQPYTCVLLGSNGASGCGSSSCPAQADNSSCACESACGCVVKTALAELSFRQCSVMPPVTPAPSTLEDCPDVVCPTPIGYEMLTACTEVGTCDGALCKLPNNHSCGTCSIQSEGASCQCNECTCEVGEGEGEGEGEGASMALPCLLDCCPEDPFVYKGSPYGSPEPTLCGGFDYNCDDDDDMTYDEYPCCHGVAEPIVNEHDNRTIYIVDECAVSNNNAPLSTNGGNAVCGACSGSTVYPGWACEPALAKKRAVLPCPDGCGELVQVTEFSAPVNVSECGLFVDHCVPPNGGDGERCCIVIRR